MAMHKMISEAENANEVLFVCTHDDCGRRVVVGKSRPRLTVIDQGDFHARHSAALGGVGIDGVDVT